MMALKPKQLLQLLVAKTPARAHARDCVDSSPFPPLSSLTDRPSSSLFPRYNVLMVSGVDIGELASTAFGLARSLGLAAFSAKFLNLYVDKTNCMSAVSPLCFLLLTVTHTHIGHCGVYAN